MAINPDAIWPNPGPKKKTGQSFGAENDDLDRLTARLDRGVLGKTPEGQEVPLPQRMGAISGAIDRPRFDEARQKGQYSTQRIANIMEAGINEMAGQEANWDFPREDAFFDAKPGLLGDLKVKARDAVARGKQPLDQPVTQLAANSAAMQMSDADPAIPLKTETAEAKTDPDRAGSASWL